jgi:glycogen debranching enzyme GlgX
MTAALPTKPKLQAGRPWPLGSHFDGQGINFAVASKHATAIELCLFNAEGTVELARETLPRRSNDVWHGYLPKALPGQVYGLRAHGPWQPELGQRFNSQKLLLDPYAKEIVGSFVWRDEHFAHDRWQPRQLDSRDNSAWALKAKVQTAGGGNFDWEGDQRLHIPIEHSVIYEMHVKGFSKLNPLVPETLRGTFAGLAHPASIAHLKALGVSAVQLLPVHFAIDEERLVKMGLRNYWGYNTLGFFSLNADLVSARSKHCPADEFRGMVKALHREGIEVLLDVVYNHTAESDENGPSLSFRGLDNSSYYRLTEQNAAQYENHTGCGNTLDIREPRVLQLVLDSLRYWVEEMHVDGFRFDLATVLGRGDQGFDARHAFFQAVTQDPILSSVKLIAEPWDIGPGGYQLGQFPPGWLEWNDQYRDATRRFWLHGSQPGIRRGEFAMRLCGSADSYQASGRAPATSINYVVSHDGFTLRDLVSYEARRNLANGEDNRDGHGHNLSFNCGAEGPSDDPKVNALRAHIQRTLVACTLLSQGTPMLCAGDELGHSQGGNNNPYCQDNEITWINWAQADQALVQFTSQVIALRKLWMPLKNKWATGQSNEAGKIDLTWFKPDGTPLQAQDWSDPQAHGLAAMMQAESELLMLFNPEHNAQSFTVAAGHWETLLDTSLVPEDPKDELQSPELQNAKTKNARSLAKKTGITQYEAISNVTVQAHTLVLLKRGSPS